MKLFKPKGKGFFNKDSLAIIDIKNIDGTDGILVTYKNGSQVVYENYDKIVDRKGFLKEEFSSAINSFNKLNNLSDEIINNIQIGDIIYYNGEFVVVDSNLLNELLSQDTTYKLDIFGDGSCIACYTFDGNANDLSKNYNGIWDGTEQYNIGKFGKSAYFNKSKINCGIINTQYDEIWVSFWMNWKGNYGVMPIGFNIYDIYIAYGDGYFGWNTGAGDIYGIDFPVDTYANKWLHIVVNFKTGDYGNTIYINGIKQNNLEQKTNSIKISNAEIKNNNFYIGGWGNDNDHNFIGYIDQVRIFNRALTPEEIQILYNEQTPLIKKLSF